MKTQITLALLALTLAACTPGLPAPSETPFPTATSTPLPPTPTLEATPAIVFPTPSPVPTQPTVALTLDTTQIERWQEYQNALAKSIFSYLSPEEVICEWEILGALEREIYLWAVCEEIVPIETTAQGTSIFSSSSVPVVIHLGVGGVIRGVEIPGPGSLDYPRLFPAEVLEKFKIYNFGRAKEMSDHIEWRRTHPEEPPLIVLSTTPTTTPGLH